MAIDPKVLRKLDLYRKDPQTYQSLSNNELADLVVVVLSQVRTIEDAIAKKKLDLDTRIGADAQSIVTKSKRELESIRKELLSDIKATITNSAKQLSENSTELERRVNEAIQNIRDGQDGIVTDEEIARAAQLAATLVDLPDFDELIIERTTANPEAIRDALELLSGDARYKVQIADVQGLEERLYRLAQMRAGGGNTMGTSKPAVYQFIRDAIADGIITNTGGGGGAGATELEVTQAGHGLAVTDVVKYASGSYSKAQADSSANAEVIGIVSAVEDANNFTITQVGYVTGLSGLTANTLYFLDPSTAGGLTTTAPSTIGQVSKPVIFATSATAGWVFHYRGVEIGVTTEVFEYALSDEITNLTTGTAKLTVRAPYAFTLTDVRASVATAPTGANLIVDINESGTSLLSTKLSIDAGQKTSVTAATAAVISDASVADDAELTFDIDQIGSTIAGSGLKVKLYVERA